MKPLPKIAGVLGVLASICSAVAGLAGMLPPKVVAIAVAVGSIVTVLSHSLTGNGVYVPPST